MDALSYQGILMDSMSEGLTSKEIEDEEYYQEREDSGYNEQGRDPICGY